MWSGKNLWREGREDYQCTHWVNRAGAYVGRRHEQSFSGLLGLCHSFLPLLNSTRKLTMKRIWHRFWRNYHEDQLNFWLDETTDTRMAIHHMERKQYHESKL